MRRLIFAFIAYFTAGIGVYHTFFGGSKVYGSIILLIGLMGILHDMFYKKLYTE